MALASNLAACQVGTAGTAGPYGYGPGNGFDPSGRPGPGIQDAAMPEDGGGQVGSDSGMQVGTVDAQGPLDASDVDPGLTPWLDAARPDAAPPESDAAVPPGPETCSLNGTFSAKVLFDVSWNGTDTFFGVIPILAAGTGQIEVLVRVRLRDDGRGVSSDITTCAAAMPDFAASALVGEVYSGYIPDAAWEQSSMPSWSLDWNVSCTTPGCAMGSELLVATYGARAEAGDTWPGRTGPRDQIVERDHDGDGWPAITFVSRDGSALNPAGVPYTPIPLTLLLTSRASRISIAFQLAGRFQGSIDTCSAFSGVITSGRVEGRALDCVGISGGSESPCTGEQINFIDTHLPDWRVHGGSWQVRRMPPDASCQQVRDFWGWTPQ